MKKTKLDYVGYFIGDLIGYIMYMLLFWVFCEMGGV